MIKNGRRGTMSGKLTVKGVQATSPTRTWPEPDPQGAPALAELAPPSGTRATRFFPATSWQISNIHGGTGAGNVIPGEWWSTSTSASHRVHAEGLQQRVHACSTGTARLRAGLDGRRPALPDHARRTGGAVQAPSAKTGLETELSTTGGTSDGRFIAKICPQVIEFGPVNASIHKIDEHIGGRSTR
jgi:succinyl-diaminopimelate desuccinylase